MDNLNNKFKYLSIHYKYNYTNHIYHFQDQYSYTNIHNYFHSIIYYLINYTPYNFDNHYHYTYNNYNGILLYNILKPMH